MHVAVLVEHSLFQHFPLPTLLILFSVMHLLVTDEIISFCKEITMILKWVTAFFFVIQWHISTLQLLFGTFLHD
jgi:hypothetical protein